MLNHKIGPKLLTGQTLLEIVVAMAIVVGLAFSLVGASLATQRTARVARNNTQATKLAQQSIEQMRVYRDRRGFSDLPLSGVFCLQGTDQEPQFWILELNLNDCSKIILDKTEFARTIEIGPDPINPSPNKREIKVTVSWEDSSGLHSVVNTTYLTEWCPGGAGPPC